MKTKWTRRCTAMAALLLLSAGPGAALAGAADSESVIARDGLAPISLAAHTSYLTADYASVAQLQSSDRTVAAATVDARGRVVVTALAEGGATVTFRYKNTQTATGWVEATLPVQVEGKSSQAAAVTAATAGLAFQNATLLLSVGDVGTQKNLSLNGSPVEAGTLLWASSNPGVLSVDAATGAYRALAAGSASLCAVTTDGKWSNAITVTVR